MVLKMEVKYTFQKTLRKKIGGIWIRNFTFLLIIFGVNFNQSNGGCRYIVTR